jgi:hypothetical protein
MITESKEMDTIETEQKRTDQTTAQRKRAPGDDGFQNLSMRFKGETLSPDDLTNRHEAQLIGEFLHSSHVSTANSRNTEHGEK